MKYLKRWIENTFPNVEIKVSDSGSCYYDIDDCLTIRVSDHFTPLPSSNRKIEIVQSLNSEEFAVRYKKSLSFFLYNRGQVKNIINAMYDMNKSEKHVQQTAENIIASNEDTLTKKYGKLLSLTRIFINNKRYDELVTAKKISAIEKAINKCEFFMSQCPNIQKVIRKAYMEYQIRGGLLLDLIIRSFYTKEVNQINKIVSEMVEYRSIIERRGKEEKAKKEVTKLIEEVTKETAKS